MSVKDGAEVRLSEHLREIPHIKRRTFESCPGRVNAVGNLSVNRPA